MIVTDFAAQISYWLLCVQEVYHAHGFLAKGAFNIQNRNNERLQIVFFFQYLLISYHHHFKQFILDNQRKR